MQEINDVMTIRMPPVVREQTAWTFHNMRAGKEKNELDSNLTELNAATHYFERGYASHRDWLAHVSRFLTVAKYVRRNEGTLLDVGCGKFSLPYTLNQARRQPAEYWGLDLRAIPAWKDSIGWKPDTTLVKMDLILDDPTELPRWPEGGFDFVTCFEVLEHVQRRHAPTLIENLYKWTKPGGMVFFSTPNSGCSPSVAENHIGLDGEIREWDYDDKLDMVKEAGFTVEQEIGTFIRVTQIPKEVLEESAIKAARACLNSEWFAVFAAAGLPRQSNNAMFILRKE